MENKVILMIEDDDGVLELNARMLERFSGGVFSFLKAKTLAEARPFLKEKIDLVLLDLMLPDGSGLDFVQEIHALATAPILMLTALREPEQIVGGLACGGDNYITKPYRMDELYARIAAMLRRESVIAAVPQTVTRGALALDTTSGRAFLRGEDMNLAPKEFAILRYFLRNEGRTIPKEELYEAVWNQQMMGNVNSFYNAVARLKKKLEVGGAFFIYTERGQGYEFTSK